MSTVSFSISSRTLPAHFIHNVLGLGKERGKIFYGVCGIGNIYGAFFSKNPADFDGRPTAGAQVLVRVSMVP